MILRLSLLLLSLFALCGCHNPAAEEPTFDISIAELKALCEGSNHRITKSYRLRGTIVATDWCGELYKSIIVKDESGGIEILIDAHHIHTLLPTYSEVEVLCNGLMMARLGEKIELGAPSTSDFPLDHIAVEALSRHIHVTGPHGDYTPVTKRFDEIEAGDISNLIQFQRVRISDNELGLRWCDEVEEGFVTTFRTLVDDEGNTFAIRTLPTSSFAGQKLPENEISVIGAIDYADDRYFLTIVNEWITQ